MHKLNQALLYKANKMGWWYNIYEDGSIEIGKHSPAGEDFFFNIAGKDITTEVQEYYEDFDPDEHAKMWVENMETVKGVPRSIRTLINDADAIDKMLYELANALRETEENFMNNNFTNFDFAQKIDGLCDDDFYEVMAELGKMNKCNGIDDFVEWLKKCLHEIEDKEAE